MSSLIDRYVAAATRHLPDSSRSDAARDIRVMIDEMVEARVVAGEDDHVAATTVLNELGDPAQVARSFESRPRYLIGPRHFEQYLSLMKVLLIWVPTTAFIALLVATCLPMTGPLSIRWSRVAWMQQELPWSLPARSCFGSR